MSDPDEVQKEKEHIRKALSLCGYPNWAFNKASLSQRKDLRQGQVQGAGTNGLKNTCVTIPYVAGVSDNIKSTFRNFGILTSFKPYNTLRQKLVNVKEKPDKEKISMLYTESSAEQLTAAKRALGKRNKLWG